MNTIKGKMNTIIGVMKQDALAEFEYDSSSVPSIGDTVVYKDTKYLVKNRLWMISGETSQKLPPNSVILEVEWA